MLLFQDSHRTVSMSFGGLNALTSPMRSSLAIKSENYPNYCTRSSETPARTLHPSLTFLLDDHSSIQLLVASLLPQRQDVRSWQLYKYEIGFFIAITCNDVFDQGYMQQLCGPPLYTLGILGLKHHSSPTFHRRKP